MGQTISEVKNQLRGLWVTKMRLSLLKIKEILFDVSWLRVRNNKYDRKVKEGNVILKKKCNDKNLTFVDNGNINTRMLNKSGLHLNEYDTTQLVNNSYYHMKKWRDKICMGNDSRRKKTNVGSIVKNVVMHFN